MIRLYLAGPMGKDPALRRMRIVRAGLTALELVKMGFAVYVPHLWDFIDTHDENGVGHVPYDVWIKQDLEWVSACDVVFRIDGPSPGADRETAYAEELGRPVFTDLEALKAWAKDIL